MFRARVQVNNLLSDLELNFLLLVIHASQWTVWKLLTTPFSWLSFASHHLTEGHHPLLSLRTYHILAMVFTVWSWAGLCRFWVSASNTKMSFASFPHHPLAYGSNLVFEIRYQRNFEGHLSLPNLGSPCLIYHIGIYPFGWLMEHGGGSGVSRDFPLGTPWQCSGVQ